MQSTHTRRPYLPLLSLALLAACDDAVTSDPQLESTAASLVIVSGDQQAAPPGAELPQPLVVRVLNASGTPVANQIVNFRVTSGGGSVFAGVSKTNAQGLAQERWTMGPQEGPQTLEARAVDAGSGAKRVFGVFTARAGASPEPPAASRVVVEPKQDTVAVGGTVQLQARVLDQAGNPVAGATVSWLSRSPGVATVDATGKVTGVSAGTARVVATSGQLTDSAAVLVQANQPPPPPPPASGDAVAYPSEEVAFIAGPQLRSGAAANPWPWFDRNASAKGLEHGAAFPATPTNTDAYLLDNYYDQGLAQYVNYYRTGDVRFRDLGRKVNDSWWRSRWVGSGSADPEALAPRHASLDGLMLRALDGRPEMWPWITRYVRYQYDVWLGMRLGARELHYGVRDGGYALTYTAHLARAHPDAAVRSEMREKALQAARDYFARLQYADGSWRWRETPGDGSTPFMQPFMVGMLMEGLIATHLLTGNATVRAAILKGVDNLYLRGYRTDSFTSYGGGKWRGMWYTVYGADCATPRAPACGEGEPMDYEDKIREVRQLNPLTLHAFGYAYKISGDAKYRTWGDEIFAATFGRGEGPGADRWFGLADFRPREYNQSYRTAGRYLAWRAGQ